MQKLFNWLYRLIFDKKPHKKFDEGFTIIEFLIVVAILSFLAEVALPSLFSSMNRHHNESTYESVTCK